jgi:hypothetical protein
MCSISGKLSLGIGTEEKAFLSSDIWGHGLWTVIGRGVSQYSGFDIRQEQTCMRSQNKKNWG